MKLGIDRLCESAELRKKFVGKSLALVAHPASVTSQLTHSLDALMEFPELKIKACFGPQHGLRGEKQYNMLETEDDFDSVHKIPVYSLYGKVRKPTSEMLKGIDCVLFDLQDVGTRIYTYTTTLLYMMEACADLGISVHVLDRPNPIGRPVEGLKLLRGNESFVGCAPIPMRHGLTLGELGMYFKKHYNLNLDYQVIQMEGYKIQEAPGYGWPNMELSWVNPSPNIPTLSGARAYPGSVMLEGTTLSEGRGTTRPLEIMGAPDVDFKKVMSRMQTLQPLWLEGCGIRICYFEPTFYKHQGKLCQGFQVHVDDQHYRHEIFKPFRLFSLAFKALRIEYPQYPLWRDFKYEYVSDRLAIDVIHGREDFRKWVDDNSASPADLEKLMLRDEADWLQERKEFLIYTS